MKKIRRFYYRIFKRYRELETVFVSYAKADQMLMESHSKADPFKWYLSKEEDNTHLIGMVYLCRRERIIE